jgi:hypothetical protein
MNRGIKQSGACAGECVGEGDRRAVAPGLVETTIVSGGVAGAMAGSAGGLAGMLVGGVLGLAAGVLAGAALAKEASALRADIDSAETAEHEPSEGDEHGFIDLLALDALLGTEEGVAS